MAYNQPQSRSNSTRADATDQNSLLQAEEAKGVKPQTRVTLSRILKAGKSLTFKAKQNLFNRIRKGKAQDHWCLDENASDDGSHAYPDSGAAEHAASEVSLIAELPKKNDIHIWCPGDFRLVECSCRALNDGTWDIDPDCPSKEFDSHPSKLREICLNIASHLNGMADTMHPKIAETTKLDIALRQQALAIMTIYDDIMASEIIPFLNNDKRFVVRYRTYRLSFVDDYIRSLGTVLHGIHLLQRLETEEANVKKLLAYPSLEQFYKPTKVEEALVAAVEAHNIAVSPAGKAAHAKSEKAKDDFKKARDMFEFPKDLYDLSKEPSPLELAIDHLSLLILGFSELYMDGLDPHYGNATFRMWPMNREFHFPDSMGAIKRVRNRIAHESYTSPYNQLGIGFANYNHADLVKLRSEMRVKFEWLMNATNRGISLIEASEEIGLFSQEMKECLTREAEKALKTITFAVRAHLYQLRDDDWIEKQRRESHWIARIAKPEERESLWDGGEWSNQVFIVDPDEGDPNTNVGDPT
jgi:hypothetical protein